ncbi:MAG TPA: hypothetical protein VEJ87_13570 [Acidimicrobiales bacterium]|nr:hypothetical protein [Acidimicrobiales bacterium]
MARDSPSSLPAWRFESLERVWAGRAHTSLKLTLERLLSAPCYHMLEVFEHANMCESGAPLVPHLQGVARPEAIEPFPYDNTTAQLRTMTGLDRPAR